MGWGELPRLRGWGFSRRATAGLLAAASILSSRPALDLLTGASELLDVALAGFLLYQVSVGDAVVGLHVAWGFIGYLVYAYTPELYLNQYGQVVEARGFRAITAGVAVYVGVVVSRAMETVPDAGAFALVPDMKEGLAAAFLVGMVASMFAFSGYFLVGRGERLIAEDSVHSKVLESWSVEKGKKKRVEMETVPHWPRKVAIAIGELGVGTFYLVPCFVLGFALAAINAFYPIPEALVVVGLVASYTPGSERLTAQPGKDIEFRIADETTDVVQNIKGLVLVVICLVMLGFSGVSFFLGLGLMVPGGEFVLEAAHRLPSLSLLDVTLVLAHVWYAIGLIILFPAYGFYGLVYWFQQVKRLPSYVTFWKAYWRREDRIPPPTSVSRPPGLFLPGNILLVLFVGLVWLKPDPTDPSLTKVVGYGLAWPIVITLVAWSVYTTFRGDAQSLAHEGRDVAIAAILQIITLIFMGAAIGSIPITLILLIVPMLWGAAYFPEVILYAQRQEGVRYYLIVLYFGTVMTFALAFFEILGAVPVSLFVVFVGGLMLGLLGVWIVDQR